MSSSNIAFCNNCFSFLINETGSEKDRQPCPCCNSITRNIPAIVKEKTESNDNLEVKYKKDENGKPVLEIQSGKKIYNIYGILINELRIIDREKDLYQEIVFDENDNIIKNSKEKLSDHKGHGLDSKF